MKNNINLAFEMGFPSVVEGSPDQNDKPE